MNNTSEPLIDAMNPPLQDLVQSACRRIPPLWPLTHFVAVNPFLGLSGLHFMEAARLMQRVGHGDILMQADFYSREIESGRIQEGDFRAAISVATEALPAEWAEQLDFPDFKTLDNALRRSARQPASARVLTFADYLEGQGKGGWSVFIVEEMSKWCSAYYDRGQSSWRMPWQHSSLWAAWKAAARLDANPELNGLKNFRAFVSMLPDDPLEIINSMLGELRVPVRQQADFLHRQLMSLPGWSSYVQYRVRERNMAGEPDDSLAQLLAIRLVYDAALLREFGMEPQRLDSWVRHLACLDAVDDGVAPDLVVRYVAQQALECGYQRELIAKLKSQPAPPRSSGRKTLQAVFCIDVRSEVYRRSLEAQADEIETIGFAGFFGMAIEYLKFGEASGGARCPVLLTPKLRVRESLRPFEAGSEHRLMGQIKFRRRVNNAWNSFKTSAISCFSFVETAGLWFGVKLAMDSLAVSAPPPAIGTSGGSPRFGPNIERETCCAEHHGHDSETGILPSDQITLAAGALNNMGLTGNFAKVVLICGHGSATANNPYGSALDCGACGGHAGDANARVAAALLNQPAVREGLHLQGIQIPADTVFLAGLHNTTTDEVVLFETDTAAANHPGELEAIQRWLAGASRQTRRERASSLGLGETPPAQLDEQVFRRSHDWAQVRPEWGLAGNAAFIAAPRERTRGLNLAGRTFLHNYDASRDPGNSILELIMVAPMVVASWINLQYYGSTVNNRLFGSGNKVLHNVVGTFGVWQGNGGDLQPGLPLQSVHDGARWRHEPLRLSVFIEADPNAIESVLAKQPGVRELIENGWISLFAMDVSGKKFLRYCGRQFVEATS